MGLWTVTAMNYAGGRSTRNHQKIEGEREEDTIPLNLTVHRILRRNRPLRKVMIWEVIQIHILLRLCLIIVPRVMIGVRRERDLLGETNIGMEKEGINGERKEERGVTGDQSASQRGLIFETMILLYSLLFLLVL